MTHSKSALVPLGSPVQAGGPIRMSSRLFRCAAMALALHAASSSAANQDQVLPVTVSAAETAPAPAADALPAIPVGTPVVIEIAEPLASSSNKRGDVFAITLVEQLLLDGIERLPRGTRGTGEIVHAAAARGGGAPGELLIAARTLETPQGQLPLRGLKLGATGDDNSGMALGVSLAAGPFAMFIRGREIEIPAGTRGIAKTKAAAPPATSTTAAVMPDTTNTSDPTVETGNGSSAVAEPVVPSQPETPVQSKE